MRAPVIVYVDDDTKGAADLVRDVHSRYGAALRVVHAAGVDVGVAACERLRADGDAVAVLMAAPQLPDGDGARFLAQAHESCQDAARVLLTGATDRDQIAGDSIVDRYLAKPWGAPHSTLYPLLEELLADWRARTAIPETRVVDVMDTDAVTLAAGADLMVAAERVARTRVSDLMVVDESGAFVGVLSEGDILRGCLPDLDEILAAGGTLADGYRLFLARARELSATSVDHLVIKQPLVLHPDDHVAKAATLLVERQIRRLPVVVDGRLQGTVSRADICRAVVEA